MCCFYCVTRWCHRHVCVIRRYLCAHGIEYLYTRPSRALWQNAVFSLIAVTKPNANSLFNARTWTEQFTEYATIAWKCSWSRAWHLILSKHYAIMSSVVGMVHCYDVIIDFNGLNRLSVDAIQAVTRYVIYCLQSCSLCSEAVSIQSSSVTGNCRINANYTSELDLPVVKQS